MLIGLRIPVRNFHRKKMFCDSNKRYNHTSSHCVNKPRVATEKDFKCSPCKSNEHNEGGKDCPRRKVLEKRENSLSQSVQKKTFAEMLQKLDPEAKMPGERETSYEQNFPLQLGKKRQRNLNVSASKASTSQESPVRKYHRDKDGNRMTTPKKAEGNPPGFRRENENDQDRDDDDITKFLKNFVNDLGLPPFVTQLIVKFVIPIVNNFISQITNSLMSKFSPASQC